MKHLLYYFNCRIFFWSIKLNSKLFYLLDEESLLLFELLIFSLLLCMEGLEEFDELVFVLNQDGEDFLGLVWVGHEHFEHVESLELYVSLLALQESHHELEIALVADILCHNVEVGPVQKQLSHQLF